MVRFTKKSMINLVVLFSLILLSTLLLAGCTSQNENPKFSKESFLALDNIEKNKSEISYEDYLKVTVKEPEITPNLKNQLKEGYSFKTYNLIFENISNKNITLACKVFLPEELSSLQDTLPFGTVGKAIPLDPDKTCDIACALGAQDYGTMSVSEKKLYDKYAKTLYIEVIINDKYDCFMAETP